LIIICTHNKDKQNKKAGTGIQKTGANRFGKLEEKMKETKYAQRVQE
jgi:hypothetical protein